MFLRSYFMKLGNVRPKFMHPWSNGDSTIPRLRDTRGYEDGGKALETLLKGCDLTPHLYSSALIWGTASSECPWLHNQETLTIKTGPFWSEPRTMFFPETPLGGSAIVLRSLRGSCSGSRNPAKHVTLSSYIQKLSYHRDLSVFVTLYPPVPNHRIGT